MTDTLAVSAVSVAIIHGIIRGRSGMIKLFKICLMALACPFLIPLVMEEEEENE